MTRQAAHQQLWTGCKASKERKFQTVFLHSSLVWTRMSFWFKCAPVGAFQSLQVLKISKQRKKSHKKHILAKINQNVLCASCKSRAPAHTQVLEGWYIHSCAEFLISKGCVNRINQIGPTVPKLSVESPAQYVYLLYTFNSFRPF